MATLFKKSGRKNYFIQWFDHKGERRLKSSGTTDKAAAQRIANKFEADAALRRERVIDPRLDDLATHLAKPIKTHLVDYFSAMSAKGGTEEHSTRTKNKIEAIAGDAGFILLRDVEADGVNRFAAKKRAEGRSSRTIGASLQAIKGFTRWLVRHGKLASDPLATVTIPSVEDDRRVVRRFLSHDEWHWLDSITRQSDESHGMIGLERALLYATAIQTGLRSNELRSLTRGKFHLKTASPFVLADARRTKNGKPARQYIQPELAAELQHFVAKKLPGANIFNMPVTYDVAEMLRADLSAARAVWLNSIADPQERIESDASDFLKPIDSENETLDFHSLRHTTASWLIRSGADIKTVQTIMRHSDIKLTIDRYGHLFPGAEADAVSRLRSAFQQPQHIRATGTETGLQIGQQSGRFSIRQGAKPRLSSHVSIGESKQEKTLDSQGKPFENRGFEGSRTGRSRTDNQGIMSPLL